MTFRPITSLDAAVVGSRITKCIRRIAMMVREMYLKRNHRQMTIDSLKIDTFKLSSSMKL